jgi:hypothetical protein
VKEVSKSAKTLNIILSPALVLVWVASVGGAHDAGLIALTSKSLVFAPTQQETRTLPTANNVGDDKDPLLLGWFNGTPEGEKEVWRQFISRGRYRAAQADDFFLSPESRKTLGLAPDAPNDAIHYFKAPYVGGDINRDGAYNDLAVIVVSKEKRDESRFGLVIFNEPTKKDGKYTTHWLYRDKNLSGTMIGWWSGGLLLVNFKNNGDQQICSVKWKKQIQSYFCDSSIGEARKQR